MNVIGRFSTPSLRLDGDLSVGARLMGMRVDHIEVTITAGEYSNTAVQEWIQQLLTRRSNPATSRMKIMVVPGE